MIEFLLLISELLELANERKLTHIFTSKYIICYPHNTCNIILSKISVIV